MQEEKMKAFWDELFGRAACALCVVVITAAWVAILAVCFLPPCVAIVYLNGAPLWYKITAPLVAIAWWVLGYAVSSAISYRLFNWADCFVHNVSQEFGFKNKF